MRFNSCQRLLAAALATASCLIGITALDAQQRPRSAIARDHDGVYAVHVVTLQGMCDRDYHWTITVADGRVTSPADGFMQASGRDQRARYCLAGVPARKSSRQCRWEAEGQNWFRQLVLAHYAMRRIMERRAARLALC